MKEVVKLNQLKVGAILSYFTLLMTIFVALFYTPIVIRLLGQSDYGLFALIGSIAAYFSIMDMGIGNAIIRYISRNRAIGNKVEESRLNGLFLLLFLFLSCLILIVGFILYSNINNIFESSLSTDELEKAKVMIVIIIINFALSVPLSIFGSIIQAYERFVFFKILGLLRIILTPSIILLFLFNGYSVVAMVVLTAVVNIIVLTISATYAIKFLDVRFRFEKIDSLYIFEILGYSFFVFLGVIVDQIYWNTDQFILGVMLGTSSVAIYAIAMQFINLFIQLSTSISNLFLPKVSILVAKKVSDFELTNLMIRYGRIQYMILSFVLLGFILFGENFISIWAGDDYKQSSLVITIIMPILIVPLIQNFAIAILYAKNLQKFRSLNLLFIAVLNVFITIPLVNEFGLIGAAIATGLSLGIGNIVVMNVYYHLKIGLNIIRFWREIIKLSMPILLSLIIGFGIVNVFDESNIYIYLISLISFSVIHLIILWFLGMNGYEKEIFKSLVNQVRKIVVKVKERSWIA